MDCRKLLLLTTVIGSLFSTPMAAEPQHGIAMHGKPKYEPGFTHFPYANPSAPKGGRLTLAVVGSFDSVHPFLPRGKRAQGLSLTYHSLLRRGLDEPFSLYANIAKSVDMAIDRRWITFTLDPRARFQNGDPITVADIQFSWQILKTKGRPNHRYYYSKVAGIDTPQPDQITFNLKDPIDRELPLILGLMPILSAKALKDRAFHKVTLRPLLASGPYEIIDVEAGRHILYQKVENFWAAGVAANKGHYNFHQVRYDYYKDRASAFEAFKSGNADVFVVENQDRWARGFDFAAAREGRVQKHHLKHGRPSGIFGLVFNTRRGKFSDLRVRRALSFAYDFSWINKNYFHNAYQRSVSYFGNTVLAASGEPDEKEKRWLNTYRSELPAHVFSAAPIPADLTGPKGRRNALRQARKLMLAAGYRYQGRELLDPTGASVQLEILLARRANKRLAERIADFWRRLGIETDIRLVDSAQYQERLRTYDFDSIFFDRDMSLSPGNEQNFYWSRSAAEQPGTRNYPGVRLKAVDDVIDQLVRAKTYEDLTFSARLLDRILRTGHYMLPLHHRTGHHVAVWQAIKFPEKQPLYGFSFSRWWRQE